MRTQINLFMLLGLFLMSLTACATPETKFIVKVVDNENQLPIKDAAVEFSYTEIRAKPFGMGWGDTSKTKNVIKLTDRYGSASDIGQISWIKQMGFLATKKGFYPAGIGRSQAKKVDNMVHNKVLNRWEPYPCELTVKLRPVKDPVPMYKKYVEMEIPENDKTVGFDLEVGDWVAPHGRGKISDFVFNMHTRFNSPFDSEYKYNLTFDNEFDGIQEYIKPKEIQSTFIWPYLSPTIGFSKRLTKYQKAIPQPGGGAHFEDNHKKNISYIFRVRTVTDPSGKIVSANYGYISGEIEGDRFNGGTIHFTYYLNPDDKSRSLEWNEVNLFDKK